MVTEIFRSVKKRGFLPTLELIFGEIIFDHKYRTRTLGKTKLTQLNDIDSVNKAHGEDYQGANYFLVKRIFSEVKSPDCEHLIDFGCGRGRILILALESGFSKVEGVEFSKELAQCAIDNLNRLKVSLKKEPLFNVSVCDAIDFKIEESADTFFFYNPFDSIVFEKVVSNIIESYRLNPRRLLVIYVNPLCRSALEDRGFKVIRIFERSKHIEAICYEYGNIN